MQETSVRAGSSLKAPPLALAALELPRALWGLGEYAWHSQALPANTVGGGQPVMILPGLGNVDASNLLLSRYLRRIGYDARGWGMGMNRGRRTIGANAERLIERIAALAKDRGQPVALIGISLGGIMARYIARCRPDLVRQVITVSSPFAGSPRATNVWRAFEWLTGDRVDAAPVVAQSAESAGPLSVPTTAIWSRSDGLVNGRICRAPDHPGMHDIEVRSSHIGVQWRHAVMRAIAGELGRGVDSH